MADSISYQWSETPLQIDLQVGTERSLHIPEANILKLGVPRSINRKLIPQIIGNHLWMNAVETFESTRVILIAEPLGRLILDVQAGKSSVSNQPIIIQTFSSASASPTQSKSSLGFVALTRWVAQQFYAPKRLREDLPGLVRVPVEVKQVDLFRCGSRIPTACSGAVSAVPLASWQSDHHYITALKLTNNISDSIVLDPRELHGIWRSAALMHARLHPAGYPGDTTMLVLISDFPFEITWF